ncbi:MAG: winged helix-turn-helix domain-containing protein, partial [Nitrososphaeraceae archaeon]
LLLPILKMIKDGFTASDIAKELDESKSLISYYIRKAKELEYVKENRRDVFKLLELTQAGKNFLDQYSSTTNRSTNNPICRLENIRFKAPVYRMPPPECLDWKKTQMNNWAQYGSKVDNITIHLNNGKSPTIEFIPSAIDGDDPYKLRDIVSYDCIKAAEKLEETLGIEIGRLEQSSRPEYVIYDPVAKAFSKYTGQVNVKGVGKINASSPRHIGEFEFHDPTAAAEYMAMPKRLSNVEQDVKKILALLTEEKRTAQNGLATSVKRVELK